MSVTNSSNPVTPSSAERPGDATSEAVERPALPWPHGTLKWTEQFPPRSERTKSYWISPPPAEEATLQVPCDQGIRVPRPAGRHRAAKPPVSWRVRRLLALGGTR